MYYLRCIAFLFLVLFSFTPSFSQNFAWAKGFGGTSDDFGNSIAVDAAGNVYTTGRFKNTADFDPGPGVFNLVSSGGIDIYISKLDASGSLVWARKAGASGLDEGLDVVVDDSGNVYVSGYFRETVDFDPGPGIFNLTATPGASSGPDIFLLKLDASGIFQWAISTGGVAWDSGNSLALDDVGNVYLTGYFTGTVDFDPGAPVFTMVAGADDHVFVSKFDPMGSFQWALAMGGTSDAVANEIALDPLNNIYVTGYYSGTVDFDPGAATFNLSADGARDVFVTKLDNSGNFLWAKTMGGAGNDHGTGIAFDSAANVYLTGNFRGSNADFNPGVLIHNLNAQGENDIFVLKLDSAGEYQWAREMGGTSFDLGSSITLDSNGDVYVTGYFRDTVDFDPGAGVFELGSAGDDDIFVQKMDTAGDFIWAKKIGGISGDQSRAITHDDYGSIYMSGLFRNTVDFDPDTSVFDLINVSSPNVFVLKLSDASFNVLTDTACGSYSLNGIMYSSSGTYIQVDTNSSGLDSLITLNLTVNSHPTVSLSPFMPNMVCESEDTMALPTGFPLGGSYVGSGVSGSVFDPGLAGIGTHLITYSYIDSNLCESSDTASIAVEICTGVRSAVHDSKIMVYPNPTQGHLFLKKSSTISDEIEIRMIDIASRTVFQQTFSGANQVLEIDLSEYRSGIYFLLFMEGDTMVTTRIRKD